MKRKAEPLSELCLDCPLAGRLPYADGEGEGTEVIIIGEAPGREERRTGRPFVGRSGKVLRATLNAMEVEPDTVRITNVVKCQPKGNRAPTRHEIACCRPHLDMELATYPDARLLLLGNTALHTLTSTRLGITRARGEWFKENGRDMLATFHPAFIARPGGQRFFDDFVLDIQRAFVGPVDVKFTEHEVLDTPQAVEAYFHELSRYDTPTVLAWDLETSGYRAYEDYILAMSLSHEVGKAWVITEEMMHDEEVHAILRVAFEHPNLLWVGHNAKFDQIFCLQHIGAYPKLHADTMMMHLALDERKGTHDLKVLCRDLLGAPDWEHVLWQYLDNREDTYAKVPRDVLYKYAGYDADFTLRLYELFGPQMREEDVWRLHDELLLTASETMMLAEYGGVTVDMDELDIWQERLEDEIMDDSESLTVQIAEITRAKIVELAGEAFFSRPLPKKLKIKWDKANNRYMVVNPEILGPLEQAFPRVARDVLHKVVCWRAKLIDAPFSAGSWQKVGTFVYYVLGLEYLSGRDVRTRGQEFSTSSASLEPYREEPGVDSILGLRTKKKLLSTYVLGLAPDHDFRVHPRWKMHSTVTGRIGCTDPNMMNQPHESGVRDFFIASPEHMLIAADYSQAELRLLAAYSTQFEINRLVTEEGIPPEAALAFAKRFFLVDVYGGGRDLHTEVTVALFGEKWGYDERMIAKAYNFGLVYGRTAKSIAEAFDIPLVEAKAQQAAFFERMPEVRRFLLHLEHQVTDPGYLVNCFGRRRRFPYIDDFNLADSKRQARNYMMQSTASDCALLGTARISQWFQEVGWGRVLVFLHDQAMVEVPECAVTIASRKLQEILIGVPEEFFGPLVPFKVDVQVGWAWSQLRDFDPVKGEYV